ncbi:hypothetical protein EV2_023392 [Malus domestica]
MEQEPRIPVSLHEYFLDDFFQQCTITACHMVEVEMEEPSKGKAVTTEGEKTPTTEEAVLASSDDHEVQESKNESLKLQPHECATCCSTEDAIHFTDKDLLLGSKPHNRPLFISGYVREHKVSRMLVDGGSAINIMPKSTMTTIGIKVDELSLSRLLIQEMTIGELKSSTIFHVIDARTSYSLLLERPWIHANGVVPSTLHQCLKFYLERVKVIYGDTKPFTEAESHFADAKFYMDEDMEWQAVPKKQEEEAMPSSNKNDDELAKPATTRGNRTPSNGPNIPVFRYIPTKADTQRHMDNVKLLKINAVLPLTQLSDIKVARPSQGFIKGLPKGVEPSFLPTKKTEEGFDPNAYKLMLKAGYNFTSSANLGKKDLNTIKDNKRDLTKTQKKLEEHGYGVNNNKARLGFTPNAPVKISNKAKNASAQHTSVSIIQDKEEPRTAPQTSVFDRMNRSRTRVSAPKLIGGQNRTSVFKRLNKSVSRSSVFKRLSKPKKQSDTTSFPPRQSVMERLGEAKEPSKMRKTTPEVEKIDRLAEKDDVRSSIPSRMKRQAILEEMPGLDPIIVAEIDKLIKAGFIREDDFPLPIIEIMELTAFRTPKCIYCYKVMPFGLKNAGATYQRAMQKIFNDMLHKNVECYVDDVVVKTKKRPDHLKDLRVVFERLQKYNLKMNPLKCAFGVTSGKFLGFIVKHRGIEVDQSKIKAIQSMPEPRNMHELKSLQGRLAFIRRFISNLAGRCQPFSRLMKKDVPFVWDKACNNAFESIKKYLSSPPVLGAPVPGKPLILYITAQESSVGALLAQENESQKE